MRPGPATTANTPATSAGHKRKSLVKIGEVTPPKRPGILGPLELGEPIDHSGTPPLPPRSSMGRFSTPPSNSDPPSYPPLGLATGADELAHAVALGLKPGPGQARGQPEESPCLRAAPKGNKNLSTEVELFGRRYAAPFGVAPMGSGLRE